MVILRVACDNFYMFKNFELDLTYSRKINHPLSKDDELFEGSRIKVRKNLIVMGANAAGKTTFGKLLCVILNFIRGNNLDDQYFSLEKIQYDKSRDASFEIEFFVNGMAYLLKASFRDYNLQQEQVFRQKVYPTYSIQKLRNKLRTSSAIEIFDANDKQMNIGFKSFAFSVSKPSKFDESVKRLGFWFMLSEPISNATVYRSEVDVEFLDKMLPAIDNSVRSVKRLQVEGDSTPTNSYQISFKNNETLTVLNGDLKTCGYRLSHGTFESIDFVFSLSVLRKGLASIFYIDERLSHMHPELEIYLARQAFLQKPKDAQLFFMTHDTELFDLNAPNASYMIFRRNSEGFNEVIFVSDRLSKNDRNLRNYYENDYFEVIPDYSVLDKLFENTVSDNE